MKIECTRAELLELLGETEAKAARAEIEQLRTILNTIIYTIIPDFKNRLDHHDALLDIHEMRTGGQAIFYRDKPVQS